MMDRELVTDGTAVRFCISERLRRATSLRLRLPRLCIIHSGRVFLLQVSMRTDTLKLLLFFKQKLPKFDFEEKLCWNGQLEYSTL